MPAQETPASTSPQGGQAWGALSTIVLLISNAVPLAGVWLRHWELFPLMLIYWLENTVVGACNVARLLTADPESGWRWIAKLALVPLFCVHFGAFIMIHGVFVFAFFGGPRFHSAIPPQPAIVLQAIRATGITPALVAVVVSHGVTFVWSYLRGGEYRNVKLWDLVRQPYARVLVLHLVVFATAWALYHRRTPTWGLAALVALKTIADLRSHLAERRRFAPASAQARG
jgi:hypothetical protein